MNQSEIEQRNADTAREFLAAWQKLSTATLLPYFTPDAVYQNIDIIDSYDETQMHEIQALQDITSKDLDERRTISTWERITIYFAVKLGAIAKNRAAKLNDINKKHITYNIMPNSNPSTGSPNRHHGIMERLWFKTMRVVCAKCNHENVFDACDAIEADISRDKLDLQVKPIVLVNAKVE